MGVAYCCTNWSWQGPCPPYPTLPGLACPTAHFWGPTTLRYAVRKETFFNAVVSYNILMGAFPSPRLVDLNIISTEESEIWVN